MRSSTDAGRRTRTLALGLAVGVLAVAAPGHASAEPARGSHPDARAAAGPTAARRAEPGAARRCALPVFGPGSAYAPRIDPASFGPQVTNPWFPLTPGTTLVYAGRKDGRPAVDLVAPSRRTTVVDGVRARVVEDRLFLDGRLVERTSDYYAQDACGNVWYFGEDTAELDARGRVVDTSGSFRAGVDGAEPGVYLPARPERGRRFRQEWYPGEAEDTFVVRDLSASVTVPYGRFLHALRTSETTALEPGVVDRKLFVRGVGEVAEQAVRGPQERLVLVDVVR
jgi:hypothetical protein